MSEQALPPPDDGLKEQDAIAHPKGAMSEKRFPDPTDPTPGRPHYYGLWEMASSMVSFDSDTLQRVPKRRWDRWVDLKLDLTEALLPLLPPDGITPDCLKRGDLKAEQERLEPPLKIAQDFVKLYAEVLKRQPPEDLQHIEQVLRNRRDQLHRINSPQTPQP